MLAATLGVPVADFESFAASCVEMQAGAGEMLQPVAVRVFRVLGNMEGVAQAGGMFPGSDRPSGSSAAGSARPAARADRPGSGAGVPALVYQGQSRILCSCL